ncbi:phosphotransferase [Acinetobacter qingfengensis]|uniref:Serine kinase n=1 Tax=Acinetobacter qingfengensis TaxID=1262585 RepID=A0A1E7R1A9_9GAMM|nr:phosphotransferase [Acinetobacter qingfengensis]KAA8733273.1 phosphotransferase [Acinetobacter qingfengensis]OEY93095.1 serine kinase [Acinetobacter qingfengensis]
MAIVEQNENLSRAELLCLAEQAMRLYPAKYQGQVQLLCQSENATFLITTATERYALRIHRPNYHQKHEIESELKWLDALNDYGVAVPQAILSEQGERVQTISLSNDVIRYAVLFEWIEGEMPTTEVDPQAFRQLGQINAKLHNHSKAWQYPDNFQRIIWNHETMVSPQGHWGDWRHATHLNRNDHIVIEETIQRIDHELKDFGKSSDRYGLIHADLRLTNLLLQNDRIGVIDFDDCGMSWYMHDLAAAISFNEHYAAAPEWIENWIEGYEREAHISNEEYALIPTFVMQRRIQMLAWIGSHAQTEMALSLGNDWANQTVRLCKKYLNTQQIPVGLI